MRNVAIEELKAIKQKYGDQRRTQIIQLGEGEKASDMYTMTDVMPVENYWIEVSETGLLSRTDGDKPNRLGGDGAPWSMIRTNTHQTVFLVTTEGRAAAISSYSVPVQRADEEGVPASKVAPLHRNDILQGIFAVPISREEEQDRYVVTVTRQGMIKRSAVADLPGASASAFTLVKINENDELFEVLLTRGDQDILLTTAAGMAIRFNENEVRSMGLVAAGVNAIKLKPGDYVVGAAAVEDKDEVALVTQRGLAKRTPGSDFPIQGRYGQGVIAWKLDKGDQISVLLVGKLTDRGVCHFRNSASKVFTITSAVSRKRAFTGLPVFTLKANDEIIGFTNLDDYVQFWESA
jgi:DNA gyrase subunit A